MEIKLNVSDKNEGTEAPYWLIVDPHYINSRLSTVLKYVQDWDSDECMCASGDKEKCNCIRTSVFNEGHPIEEIDRVIPSCITGPFFSREEAENHIKNRSYNFSSKTYVYCFSGYWSKQYKEACREGTENV